jgi:monoamine oxidase
MPVAASVPTDQRASPREADVVVVGAGLAGLSAVRALTDRGASVILLESRDRVGGRVLSHPLGHDVVDLGAQWIGPGQNRIARLADELGVATFPQWSRGRKLLELGGRRRAYRGTIPALPLPSLLDLQLAITRIGWLSRRVPLDRPAGATHAAEWDRLAVADWLRRHVRTSEARAVLAIATQAIFAVEPADLSLLHFLFYVRSGGGLMRLASVRGGAQQTRFLGGAQRIAQRLAERLTAPVILNAPVDRVAQHGDRVLIDSEQGPFCGRYAIITIPPPLRDAIAFDPPLPPDRAALTQAMPMGSVIKCVVAYRRPWWRDDGWSGEVVSDSGPLRMVFDDTPPDESFGALVAFISGDAARAWTGRPAADRARMARDELARFFGPRALDVVGYVEKDWPADAWSRGCFAGYFPPRALTRLGDALRAPVGRIHWAGTETAREWNGYMDGAIESGERAAAEIAARLRHESPSRIREST